LKIKLEFEIQKGIETGNSINGYKVLSVRIKTAPPHLDQRGGCEFLDLFNSFHVNSVVLNTNDETHYPLR